MTREVCGGVDYNAVREILREELKPPAEFRSRHISRRGIREVHSLMWYKDRLLAGVGPVDGGLYDALTGELIAPLPYSWADMWAKFYHEDRDIAIVGPFVYDGEKVKVLPAIPSPDFWRVYWYALDLTDPENYVIAGTFDSGVWRINLDTLAATKILDYPVTPAGVRSGVAKTDGYVGRDRLIIANSKHASLYVYDPVSGWINLYSGVAWMTVATPLKTSGWPIVALGYAGDASLPNAYAVCYPEDADRVKQLALLPRDIPSYDRSEINNWLLYMNYSLQYLGCIGDMLFLVGDMYRGDASVEYLGTLPHHAFSAEIVGNTIALGSGARGTLGGLANPYWGTDVCSVTFLRIDDLSKLPKRPAVATIWSNTSVSAGAYSLPVVVNGWSRRTLMFTSSAAGTLAIEVDMVGDGDWKTYDTVSVSANTLVLYTFTGGFAKLRLSFSAAATVTAKLYVEP